MARRVHHVASMSTQAVSREDVAVLLGEVDASVAERIASTGATVDDLGAALDDLDHERRFGERRIPSSATIAEIRGILEDAQQRTSPGARVIDIHGAAIGR